MRIRAAFAIMFLAFILPLTVVAEELQKPEAIVEKMSFKFVRGVANIATAPAELPKQTILTVRERGGIGYLIGPLKGVGMTVYRALMGGIETVFFMVPQPGYYDSIIEPDYVWNGWDKHRLGHINEITTQVDSAAPPEKKGE